MFYKVEKGTETFRQLQDLKDRMKAVQKHVHPILDELGVTRYAPGRCLAGGIAAVEFEKAPAGWKQVGKPGQKLYYPRKDNKAMRDRLAALPTLDFKELNDIVGYPGGVIETRDDGAMVISRHPGIQWKKDVVVLSWSAKKPAKNKDLVEILESEYNRLCNAK